MLPEEISDFYGKASTFDYSWFQVIGISVRADLDRLLQKKMIVITTETQPTLKQTL